MSLPLPKTVETLIVGAGFSGVCLAIKLLQARRSSFLLIDRSHDLGGTWNFNRFPGCACDVPSHLYSFSFEPNPDWSHMYADRAEIHSYLKFCAQKHRVLPHLRLKTEMRGAFWDETAAVWHVEVLCGEAAETIDARFLVSAVGGLHVPKFPEIRGRENFAGLSFHSSAWDSSVDLNGKVVAVLGTGASAIQIVPRIATVVRKLYVFQRTPAWVLPKPQFRISPLWRKLFRRLPVVMGLFYYLIYWVHESFVLIFLGAKSMRRSAEKLVLEQMEKHVHDPDLRAALVPKYELGCKRVLLSNKFYAAVAGPSVELVTRSIKEVREHSIVSCTPDGEESEENVDVIVYATGFQLSEAMMHVVGRDGLELKQAGWASMLGITKFGFPNFFMLMGPNSGLGHTSVILMMEAQVSYVLSCMKLLLRKSPSLRILELCSTSQDNFQEFIYKRFFGTVWHSGGCQSWYKDPCTGQSPVLWPASTLEYWYRTRSASPSDYHLR